MTPAPDDPVVHRAKALFTEQVSSTDDRTRAELRRRRREALAAPARRTSWAGLWPVGGAVTAALVLALVVPRGLDVPPETVAVREAPLATDAASDRPEQDAADFADHATLELDNDAAFYAWLGEAPIDVGDGPTTPLNEGWTL